MAATRTESEVNQSGELQPEVDQPEEIQPEIDQQPEEIQPGDIQSDEIQLVSFPSFRSRHQQELFNIPQKIGQESLKYVNAAAPPFLFGQCLTLSPPWNMILGVGVVPFNNIVGEAITPLMTKEEPLSSLRAAGVGHVGKGLMKVGTSNLAALSAMTIAGYFLLNLTVNNNEVLLTADNASLQQLGGLLNTDVFMAPMVGTLSYLGFKGIRAIGMKLWECCWSREEEKQQGNNPKLYLVQHAGQYLFRIFNNEALTETIFFYLRNCGQTVIASDRRIQIAIFLGTDVALQLGQYFAFVPHPIRSLVPIQEEDCPSISAIQRERDSDADAETTDLENNPVEQVEVDSVPLVDSRAQSRSRATLTRGQIAKAMMIKAFVQFGIVVGAYAISEFTCAVADANGSLLCQEDTLASRISRYTVSLGIPLALDFSARHAVQIAQGVMNCCTSLFGIFSRRSGVADLQPLLEEANADAELIDAIDATSPTLSNS